MPHHAEKPLPLTMADVAYLRSLGDRAKDALTTNVGRQWFYDFAERVKLTIEAAASRPATSPETCPTCHAIRIEYPRCVNPDHSAQGHWRGHGVLRGECQPCSDPFHSRAK